MHTTFEHPRAFEKRRKRRVIIIGHQQHGKDYASEYLKRKYGLTYSSSSWFACQLFLFEQMRESHGYESPEDCFADRHNHTAYWYEAIRAFNDPVRNRLSDLIFAQNDIYCGMRDLDEFNATNKDVTIFIDAERRMGIQSAHSMKIPKERANIVIANNTSIREFEYRLDHVYRVIWG